MTTFVTAFNGARDYFSLPLALYEAGQLERHVTDLYLPDRLGPSKLIAGTKLASRWCPGLPRARTSTDLAALVENARLMLWPGAKAKADPYLAIDRSLSLSAARLSERTGADLFLYSGYGHWAFRARPTARKYLFQFHPHAASVYRLLQADVEAHPEVRFSFEHEEDSRPSSEQSAERLDEWKLADRILCASSYTKRSLVEQGCAPERIAVAPYGVDTRPRPVGAPAEGSRDLCRFLFVGQGVQRKGLHHLLKAWKRGRPDASELTIVARRLDPGLAPLMDQPGVRYLPGVSSAELDALYQAADVFVMPSMVEGFGLVYGEALNHGLFCIGTTNTGLPDFHLSDRAALLVPVGDVDALGAALAAAFDLWRAGAMSKPAIQAAVAAMTWQAHRRMIREFAAGAAPAPSRRQPALAAVEA